MPLVKMNHPKLGDAQTIEVDSLSVPHHKRAGWRVAGDRPDAPAQTTSRRKSEDK